MRTEVLIAAAWSGLLVQVGHPIVGVCMASATVVLERASASLASPTTYSPPPGVYQPAQTLYRQSDK